MNENLKALTERIARDQKRFSEQRNLEGVYVCGLACGWVEKYLTDASELARRRDALGRILNHPDFQSALRQSREILPVDAESVGKCETVAALLTRFAESDVYLENAALAGYRLPDKFKLPATFETDVFVVHGNLMTRFYAYLCELNTGEESPS